MKINNNRIIHRFIKDRSEYEQGGSLFTQIIPVGVQAYSYELKENGDPTKPDDYIVRYVLGTGSSTYMEIANGLGKDEDGNPLPELSREYMVTSLSQIEWIIENTVKEKFDSKITHLTELTEEYASENLGEIVQYIGDETGDYSTGYFYQACKEIIIDEDTSEETIRYYWERVSVQPETDLKPIEERVEVLEKGKVDKTTESNKIYGTDSEGNQTTYDKEDFGKVDDVRLNGVSVVGIKEEKVADIDLVAADSEYHNDAVASITNVQQALDNLMNIHYYINPSYTTFTVDRSGNYDVGTVLSQPFTVIWVLNKQPESVDIETLKYEGTTLLDIMSLEDTSKWKSGTYTYTNDITSNSPKTYTFRVDYTDKHSTVPSGKTNTCNSSRTFNFMYRRYWGVTSTETLSDEQLYALSNELSTTRSQERDFNCSGGKYWWFVIPTIYCSGIQFTDVGSGLPMTLPPECITSRTITNSQGISYSVNVYRGEYKQTASSVKIRIS